MIRINLGCYNHRKTEQNILINGRNLAILLENDLNKSIEVQERYLRSKLGTLSNVGIVLLVENYSGFTLGDPRQHVHYGYKDTKFGNAARIGPREKEVFFFHNYNELRASGGSLSWTVYQDGGKTPVWVSEENNLGRRIHVMWRSKYWCNKSRNKIRILIRKVKLYKREENSLWSWLKDDESEVFKKFQEKIGRIGCHQDSVLSVNVTIGDNCLPLARLKIFSKLIWPAEHENTPARSRVGLYITALVSVVGLLIVLTIILTCYKVE